MIIILVGPPGSGKGTQSKIISQALNVPYLSTGDILRSEIKAKTSLGILVAEFVNVGKLIPSYLMNDVVKHRIANDDCANGYILDGYPRTVDQAKDFDQIIKPKTIDIIFEFNVSDDILIKRVLGRFSCAKCGAIYNEYFHTTIEPNKCDICGENDFVSRMDDELETLKARINDYHSITMPLLDFYKKSNKVERLDCSKKIEEITESILKSIKIT